MENSLSTKVVVEHDPIDEEVIDEEVINEEVIDHAEIKKSVRALVPSFEEELKDGYCHACQEFPMKWSQIVRQYGQEGKIPAASHLSSIWHLEAASVAGCRLCRLLFHQISPTDLLYAHKVEKMLKALDQPTTLLIWYEIYDRLQLCYMHNSSRSLLPLSTPISVSNIGEQVSFSRTLKISNQLIENPINLAKKWLHACTQEHSACNASTTHPLPTRLLFLDSNNTTDGRNDCHSQSVRLIETLHSAQGAERVKYATLSHCWGGLDFLKLTTGMLDVFKIGIPFDLLTKTFRDAINVTRDLGLRYIWIDSLCIIQDSIQDWDIEASRMSSVYGGSFINIAASGARDGSEGLFLKLPNFVGGAYFPPSSSITAAYGVALKGLYGEGIPGTHLASRAWAFQERLLSPRTLHFSSVGLFFECQTREACESFPNVFPEALKHTVYIRPRKSMYEAWLKIVEIYSRCSVTFSKDKLVALAGVARVAGNESGDDYLAGLWRSKMEEMLCWVPAFRTVRPKDGQYRAPTWSWASVDGGVYYQHSNSICRRSEKLSRVLDVCVSPLGLDSFGQISGGVLTLGCTAMLPAILIIRQYVEVKINAKGHEIKVHVWSDEHCKVSEYTKRNEEQEVIMVPILQETPMIDTAVGRGNVVQRPQDLGKIYGLLLQQTLSKKGEFRRAGHFTVYRGEREWESFSAALEELGAGTAQEYCAETRVDPKTGKEQYVITII